MDYEQTIEDVVRVVEAVGAAIMVVGGLIALTASVPSLLQASDRGSAYRQLRGNLGRVILVGLEVLIIGDIVRTIVVDPTADQVLVMGVIVLIRIVLSFALEVEIDGWWPWREHAAPTCVDVRASSNIADNVDHSLGPFVYTISCMRCMTVSLAQRAPASARCGVSRRPCRCSLRPASPTSASKRSTATSPTTTPSPPRPDRARRGACTKG